MATATIIPVPSSLIVYDSGVQRWTESLAFRDWLNKLRLLVNSGGGTGTVTSVTGDLPIVITGDATTIPNVTVNTFTGDSGSGGLRGVVPAPSTGDAAKFLRGDATWQTVSGGSGTVTSVGLTMPSGYTVTGSPVTTSGTLAVTGPLTTKGDLLAFSTVNGRVGVGTDYQVLTADSTNSFGVSWQQAFGTSMAEFWCFGDGSDGALSISSGTTTLTRDTFYTDVTITGTGKLVTSGFRCFINGTLDIANAPASAVTADGRPGNAASGGNGGSTAGGALTMLTAGTIGSSTSAGPAGGTTTAGTQGTNNTTIACGNGGNGGAGGAGGAGTSGAGGVARTPSVISATFPVHVLQQLLWRFVGGTTPSTSITLIQGGSCAPSGSSGAGGGAGINGGGGGGAGDGGNVLYLAARIINRGGSTAVGAISANGGASGAGGNAGGAGNAGGGGGAGGAGAGWVYLIYERLTGSSATNCVRANGGAGAAGGTGIGTGGGGTGGTGGNSGLIQSWALSTGIATNVTGTNGAAPTTPPSGTTAGNGGLGGVCQLTL